MLVKKMLREMRANFGQFFSVFLLAALAMAIYATFEGHVLSERTARKVFHEECSLSDLWIYSEGFSEDQLETVRGLDFVESAQLRTSFTGTAPDCDGAQVDIYLENEDLVNRPVLMEGEAFDPMDSEGVWLTQAFAQKRSICVGDAFTMEYKGVTFTRTVRGLVESAEYEYRQADGDADVYLENIAFVYMGFVSFPIRDYAEHLIATGKITADDIRDNPGGEDNSKLQELLKTVSSVLPEAVEKQLLLAAAGQMSDEELMDLMPYTTMIVKTTDAGALSHEDEIAEALDHDYAAMVDRSSIAGLARLDSELEQHQAFSYIFAIVFLGIAMLVIATSMKRMVDKQRTQIGTLNALGMRRSIIMFHYISFSLLVSLLGSIAGLALGVCWGVPFMLNIFGAYYIVPGRTSQFSGVYLVLMMLITAICSLTAFFSCRRLLRIHPAEALRPAPPRQGKRCIFEKLPFWERLSFSSQYNLRDISRGKLRAFMGVAGTAAGMLLMVYGVGCYGLMDQMVDISFQKTVPAVYQVKLSEDISSEKADAMEEKYSGELIMADAAEVSAVPDARSADKKKGSVTVLEGKGMYNILDVNNEITQIPEGTVALSRRFASELHISEGDTIYWHLYSQNEWHEATVGVIYRSSESQGITMLRSDYEASGAEYTPSLMMTDDDMSWYDQLTEAAEQKNDAAGNSDAAGNDAEGNKDASGNGDAEENTSGSSGTENSLSEMEDGAEDDTYAEYMTAVISRADMISAFETSMEVVNYLIYMMIAFASVLIVVVLYNSGSLSYQERVKEFATLKVMGLQSSRIRGMLTEQNVWLSLIGIVLGAPLGQATFNAMMNSNGENFDYLLVIHWPVYVISGILVLIVSMLVSFLFSGRIRKIDMVETLKGME